MKITKDSKMSQRRKPPPPLIHNKPNNTRITRSETDATLLEKVIPPHHNAEEEEDDTNCHRGILTKETENRNNRGRRHVIMMTSLSATTPSSSSPSWKENSLNLMKWTLLTSGLLLLHNSLGVSADAERNSIASNNNWERPGVMPKIAHLEVMCGNSHMEVHLAFDKPFHGLVTSKGMYGQGDCIYVPPRTGKNTFVFNIYYDKCGTKPDNHGKFYENTVVVQYDEELIEAWDEAKRLRCEWFNDYEKTATKTSPMVISDLDIVELNFHGDNVDCWMEIQEGKGPWAAPLNGIAPLGSPLTMVIAVKDPSGEFDMRVKDCEASDGSGGRTLPLSDPEGCIVRPKLLGKFSKVKLDDGRATVLTYAFISAFKFPDMLNVHLRCTVEICRHGCPDHCTSSPGAASEPGNLLGSHSAQEPVASGSISSASFAKANPPTPASSPTSKPQQESGESSGESSGENKAPTHNHHPHHQQQQQPLISHHRFPHPHPHQQQVLHSGEMFGANVPPQMRPPPPPLIPQFGGRPQRAPRPQPHHFQSKFPPGLMRQRPELHRFPPGPPPPSPRFTGAIKHTIPIPMEAGGNTLEQTRQQATLMANQFLKAEPKKDGDDVEGRLSDRSGEPSSSKEDNKDIKNIQGDSPSQPEKEKVVTESKENGGEREMLMEAQPLKDESPPPPPSPTPTNFPKGPRNLRMRRSVSTPSDVIGVVSTFKVVSQADLDFVLNPNSSFSSSSSSSDPTTIILRGSRMGGAGGSRASSSPPIYGICLPRLGFGVVFFGLGLATLVAILIAAFLAYAHYAVVHYKQNASVPQMMASAASAESHPHFVHQFPMLILKKMW